jgi:CHASE3 domain sensor protein
VSLSNTLRRISVFAVIVISSVVWVVYRTVERAQTSNQWVVHTQMVLTAIETVLADAVDADDGVRSYVSLGDARRLASLDRAERTLDADVKRVAALTADNPNQQARAATSPRRHAGDRSTSCAS